MRADGIEPDGLRVDGGMVANGWLMQFIADILDQQVDRPVIAETTALGAAILAMLGRGEISNLDGTSALWKLDKSFSPAMNQANRDNLLSGWQLAVKRTLLET
jgi:glycerol kinase